MSILYSGSTRKIKLSKHSFTDLNVIPNDKGIRKFSNINTQAIIYTNEELQQIYTGLYLDENLHNVGTYRWVSDEYNNSHKYDGKIFLNNIHGYGILYYPNDVYYEGLFHFNKKFGPGVVTYTDGTQDVGIWNGNDLIRVCDRFSISDYYKENIPKLSGLIESKLHIMQFKELIPIKEKYKDPGKRILTSLGAPDTVLMNKRTLYSDNIRNVNSTFLNEEKLYKNFFSYEDELYPTIDVIDHIDERGNPVKIKLEVCNLIAWNNGEVYTAILRHAFLNRHYEKLISYRVKDILCAKKRGPFLPPGIQETRCQKLICACRAKDPRRIRKIISEYNVYPDVADCRGNNTVTYATLANRHKNIKVLAEFGANLDSLNDDCITPLMFGILQYIAILYDITNALWEPAFIYAKTENEMPACNQRWPVRSETVLLQNSTETSQLSVLSYSTNSKFDFDVSTIRSTVGECKSVENSERRESFVDLLKDYVFPLDCIHTKRAYSMRKTVDQNLRVKRSTVNVIKVNVAEVAYARFKTYECKKIMRTMQALLLCGADPNKGEVPFCPIITAIFSKSNELIRMLISFNANVNAKTSELFGRLGPLHVLASLVPCIEQLEMAFIFLENGAYVDDLSNSSHWIDEQNILLADQNPDGELEKTPLHLICMRYDYWYDTNNYLMRLASMLIQYGASLNARYVGHTPLTLAMIRGNIELMEHLLDTGLVNPNEGLGYNMGVPLTMCTLPRYSRLMSYNVVQELYSVLEKYYANPFNNVPNFEGNALEFCHEQYAHSTGKRGSFSRQHQAFLLQNYAKQILLRYIQCQIVQILYQFKIICGLDSPVYSALLRYISYSKTIKMLRLLVDHDQIIVSESNFKSLLLLVDKKQTHRVSSVKSFERYPVFHHFENHIPELDPDEEKYKVCFQCFRRTNQTLVQCPKCEMVYFCSQECNIQCDRDPDSGHPCRGRFYDTELYNSQFNKKQPTRLDAIRQKSEFLIKLLAYGDITLEEFSKMPPKEKRKSLAKVARMKMLAERGKDDESEYEEDDGAKKGRKGKDKKRKSKGDKTGKKRKGKIDEILGDFNFGDDDDDDKKSVKSCLKSDKKGEKGAKQGKKVAVTVISKDKLKSRKSSKKGRDYDSTDTDDGKRSKKSKKSRSDDEDGKKLKKPKKSKKSGYDDDDSDDDYGEKRRKRSKKSKKSDDEKGSRSSRSSKRSKRSKKARTSDDDDEDLKRRRKLKRSKSKKAGSGRDTDSEKRKRKRDKSSGRKKIAFSPATRRKPHKLQKPKKRVHISGVSGTSSDDSRRKKSRSRGTSKTRSQSTEFGEKKYKKLNINLKAKGFKSSSTAKPGLAVFIGSKQPVIDMEKRNLYLKLRAQMLEKDRELNAKRPDTARSFAPSEKFKIDKFCTENMLSLARKKLPNFLTEYETLDVKFWQIFSPYCIFENGQLYYNFNENNNNEYVRITYSPV